MNFNPDSPLGTIASLEHVLRSLRGADDAQREVERKEKVLADYKAQLDRPFEHEARLKELLARQAQLNAVLDLDKHDAQAAAEAPESEEAAYKQGISAARPPLLSKAAHRAFPGAGSSPGG